MAKPKIRESCMAKRASRNSRSSLRVAGLAMGCAGCSVSLGQKLSTCSIVSEKSQQRCDVAHTFTRCHLVILEGDRQAGSHPSELFHPQEETLRRLAGERPQPNPAH